MADDFGDLRKLAVDLTKAGVVAGVKAALAVRKAALDVEAEAKRRAPVDTGMLRNSIGTDVTVSGPITTATIGPSASYGPYLEYGTRRMAPQPYMCPALDKVAPGFEAAIASIGGDLLDE